MIHTVYFWLNDNCTLKEKENFLDGLKSLRAAKSINYFAAGPPSATRRPSIDHTYDFGLLTVFADRAGHDAYQTDPVHKKFLENFSSYWKKVTVYDFDEY